MELLLIRHAEPVRIVAAERPADPPQTDRGHRQAEALAQYLRDEPRIDGVWSSPMMRARETAEPVGVALGLDIVVDTELAEYDREATSYIPMEELKASKDERWLAMIEGNFESEGVDPVEFQRGVVRAIDHIITGNPGATIAAVCHGGVINAYVGHVLGISKPLWYEPRYTSIQRVFASRRGDRSIGTLNETAHLRGTDLFV